MISKSEQAKWQAESDAHTMATYQEIINDPARMRRAIKEADRQAKDLNKRASAMQNAARVKSTGGKISSSGSKKRK